jgi:hypothetical protein
MIRKFKIINFLIFRMICFVVTFFVQLSDTFAMKIETKQLESAWRGGLRRMMAVLEWAVEQGDTSLFWMSSVERDGKRSAR